MPKRNRTLTFLFRREDPFPRTLRAKKLAGRAEKPPKLFRREPPRFAMRGGDAFPPPPLLPLSPKFLRHCSDPRVIKRRRIKHKRS